MLTTLFLLLFYLARVPTPHQDPPPPSQQTPAAAPQPCADAKTQLATNECFGKLFESSDAQLNIAYNHIVNAMKKNLSTSLQKNDQSAVTYDQTAMDKLLAAQRAWLTYRDANCDSIKFQYEGGSIQPTIWAQCMNETTQQRITTLTTAYDLGN
ncbi:MAG: lysozyme inhibitor LprI family protein [Candidatus Acidiferrum sp.]|jgi:uncharacterized protein YecT (DUF1311 family)